MGEDTPSSIMPIIEPYHPPTLPSTIHHVALSSKSFRVFGLKDPAWRNARKEWRLYKSRLGSVGAVGGGVGGGGDEVKKESKNQSSGGGGGILKPSLKSSKGNLIIPDDDSDFTSDEESDANNNNNYEVEEEVTREEEEQEELTLICDAIQTALKEDAGGFGTAGFHVSKVEHVQQLSSKGGSATASAAVFNATLVPHDADTHQPIDPASLLSVDDETEQVRFVGNDEVYLRGAGNSSRGLEDGDGGGVDGEGEQSTTYKGMQIRITVSKAAEGLAAKRYYEMLFAKRKELAKLLEKEAAATAAAGEAGEEAAGAGEVANKVGVENGDGEGSNATNATNGGGLTILDLDVDLWVEEDAELRESRDALLLATTEGGGCLSEEEGDIPLGYYVEMMLVEPHVGLDEFVISPPFDLDKLNPTARAVTTSKMQQQPQQNNQRSIFHQDLYTSPQFTLQSGQWEKVNQKAFGDIGLDVRKALVRVEFPRFPEGCAQKTFREVYQLNARLKSGSFATVCRGTHRATGKKIAVKCVLRKDLPPSDDAAIYDEVLILSTLRHSYICPLIDFFEERECYFLVMELMSGGDLFDRIGRRKSYTENDARDLCRKMLESVRYCHENSVAHCDMKPKNLLLVSDEDDVAIKLADFGFATRVYEPRSLTKQCGTPFFVAPEVLMRSPYDQQSDLWSCGVIMFLLLGGDLPFVGRNQKELFRNIVMGRYEFEEQSWSHVSEEAKELVKGLLVTDPSKRLSCREAMASPWMRQRGNMLAMNNLQYTSQRLKGFNARMKLRASMISVRSVVSMRMSLKSIGINSNRSVGSLSGRTMSSSTSKRPSFLDLPDEENMEEMQSDDEAE